MDFIAPWPAIFAFDLGRYLLTATVMSALLLLIPAGVVTLRRVRDRLPRTNQRWHELRQSVLAAIVFSLVGLGVYHGAQRGLFRVYSEAAQYGWAYWAASLVLVIVAHDAYFYWAHRWMHRPGVFRRVHRTGETVGPGRALNQDHDAESEHGDRHPPDECGEREPLGTRHGQDPLVGRDHARFDTRSARPPAELRRRRGPGTLPEW